MANSPIKQHGNVTPGHLAVWGADGYLTDGPPANLVGVGYSQPAFHVEAPTPTPTNSAAYVMMGLALTFVPQNNCRSIFTADGQIGATANNSTVSVTIVGGTGSAPVNGQTLASTNGHAAGQPARFVTPGAGDYVPFSQTVLIPGLVAGTSYWVDIAVSVSAGSSILTQAEITGFVLVDV